MKGKGFAYHIRIFGISQLLARNLDFWLVQFWWDYQIYYQAERWNFR